MLAADLHDAICPFLRSEYDVVLAHSLRVGQAVRLVCHGGRLSGPVRPEQTHLTPLGGRPRARAEPSTRTRIIGGFLWARAARSQAQEPTIRHGGPDGRRADGNI